MTVFAFYLFALSTLAGGLFTVIARNPVHSVLWLILAFLSSAGLFVLLGAEFVAMLLIIVYVGAVAVLFLFVVMMLDVDFAELKAEMAQYMPLALLIGVILVMQFGMAVGAWQTAEVAEGLRAQVTPVDVHNTHALGVILYDDYFLLFQLAGLILLVAMIGAIVLTLRHRQDVKRQNVLAQMYRDPAKAMELKDVKPGQGLGDPDPAPDAIRGLRARADDEVPEQVRDGDRRQPGTRQDKPGRAPGRTRRNGPEAQRDDMIGLEHYLTVAAVLFVIGIFGLFLNRKNVIILLMSIELMLLAVNINLVAFSAHLGDLVGQVFTLFVLTVAAAEAAIGLAILVCFFRNRGTIAVEDINVMKG